MPGSLHPTALRFPSKHSVSLQCRNHTQRPSLISNLYPSPISEPKFLPSGLHRLEFQLCSDKAVGYSNLIREAQHPSREVGLYLLSLPGQPTVQQRIPGLASPWPSTASQPILVSVLHPLFTSIAGRWTAPWPSLGSASCACASPPYSCAHRPPGTCTLFSLRPFPQRVSIQFPGPSFSVGCQH